MLRVRLGALALLLLAGCAGPSASDRAEAAPQNAQRRAFLELAPFQSAFESLQAALDHGEDDVARRILARLLSREPQGVALERARAYGRILDGRELVGALALALSCEPAGEPGEYELTFSAGHSLDGELLLRGAPPSLRVLFVGLDAHGIEQRFAENGVRKELAELRLPAHATARRSLGRIRIPRGSALAVRARCELEFLPGEILREGQVLPAHRVRVEPCEVVLLAPYLPGAPVEPGELARYAGQPQFQLAPLLERAVRIENSRRGQALDAIAPVVARASRVDLERLGPALRWLSGNRELGADPEGWRRWMSGRASARTESALERPPGGLELPQKGPYRHGDDARR
jgi:hypothetical protein